MRAPLRFNEAAARGGGKGGDSASGASGCNSFNEAAARGGGKGDVASGGDLTAGASMRPPHAAAEKVVVCAGA